MIPGPTVVLQAETGLTPDIAVVFAIIAIVLFIVEPAPVDVTALGLLVTLVVLEPWTGVTPADGLSGFASPATLTVLAMFMLSEGVRRTGAIQLLSERIAEFTADSDRRTQFATIGMAGPFGGFVNNTPVVAIMYLTPARLPAEGSVVDEFGVSEYLTDVVVLAESPLIGWTVRDVRRDEDVDFDVFELIRG